MLIDVSVIREMARRDTPSTKRVRIVVRCAVLSLFIVIMIQAASSYVNDYGCLLSTHGHIRDSTHR